LAAGRTSGRPPSRRFLDHLDVIEGAAADGNVDAVMACLRGLIPEYATPEIAVPPVQESENTQGVGGAAPLDDDVLNQECPACKAGRVHRSKARNMLERLQRDLKEERLYRCDECGWRGWLTPLVYSSGEAVADHDTPDLRGLDAAVASVPSVRRASFSPRNLQ
jgi:hypothetical protein